MKFSITTANTTQFVMGILMLVGAVAIPALAGLIWILFFRKNSRRRRRRRESTATTPTLAQTGGLPPIRHKENMTDQPKS
jgi:hypothetical protein